MVAAGSDREDLWRGSVTAIARQQLGTAPRSLHLRSPAPLRPPALVHEQMAVEKELAVQGQSRLALGREAFERRVWEWKEECGGAITRQLRRLGASCDWSRERFTLDAGLSSAVVEAFSRLASKGLVYRGAYMVNWSPGLCTAVSDLEVEYVEEEGTLYYFKYPLADAGA